MAGGRPVSHAVADEAAHWLTVLMSGEATAADREEWQRWRGAHPEHERAWQHIEKVAGRLKILEPAAAYKALSPFAQDAPRSPARRRALNMLLWGGAGAGAVALASRTETWQLAAADYRTGTGEQRRVVLPDGAAVTLNTGTAIDVRFDAGRRVVRLIGGEVMVATARAFGGHDPDPRPFVVETADGAVRALGTRFIVRQWEGRTSAGVIESSVEVAPSGGGRRVLRAGERTFFTRAALGEVAALDDRDAAWLRGQIVADNMPLADFMAELGRYRRGIVQCDPAVAGLRLSGVFPLEDTGSILATLPSVLPVQVRLRTRFWVMVEPAAPA